MYAVDKVRTCGRMLKVAELCYNHYRMYVLGCQEKSCDREAASGFLERIDRIIRVQVSGW